MPARLTQEDVDALVAFLRDSFLAGSGETGSAARAAALEFARERAGDMVGMSWDEDSGKWVQAKRPEYRIAEDIRRDIRDEVVSGISRGETPATIRGNLDMMVGDLGPRALATARTESAMALNAGNIGAGRAEGVTLWEVVDGPGCLPDGHDDDAAEPDDAPGTVQLDKQASGQVWTTEQCEQYVLGHPNCARYFIPVAWEGD